MRRNLIFNPFETEVRVSGNSTENGIFRVKLLI